jgi:alpha-1,3-mannosyltransferase
MLNPRAGWDKKSASQFIIVAFSACIVLASTYFLLYMYDGNIGILDPSSPIRMDAPMATVQGMSDALREDSINSIVHAIMDPSDSTFDRLHCPPIRGRDRYDYLKISQSLLEPKKIKYFFALDLFECTSILPTLLGAVVEAMEFLGVQGSALSVVEGRSTDGTYEILANLQGRLGAKFYLVNNDTNPRDGSQDRIAALAGLRNQALRPLIEDHRLFASDAVVIFLNDITICAEDVLELLHQQQLQSADMTCAMDWNYKNKEVLFYDVWVARGISGDTFFEVPQSSEWTFAGNLFWNDRQSKQKLKARETFQVYACWNGVAVFRAKPIMDQEIAFRRSVEGECVMGEPTLFGKDLWRKGYGKIQVVPTVNVAYSVLQGRMAKRAWGWAGDTNNTALVDWKMTPPPMVKCAGDWGSPSWVPPL